VVLGPPLLEGSLLSCRTLVGDNVGVVRITWFLDRLGNQPSLGPALTLDVGHLSPGRHTLLVYAVDGELNYSMASCTFIVKP